MAVAVVAVVLGAAALTSLLPTSIQTTIFHAPVLIVVLIVGTGWLLWRISRDRGNDAAPSPAAPTATDPSDRADRP